MLSMHWAHLENAARLTRLIRARRRPTGCCRRCAWDAGRAPWITPACARCAGLDLKPITTPRCDVTGQPFPYDPGEGVVSAAALADPPAWDRARAAVEFNETSRRLVHALKYHDRHEAGRGRRSRHR